MTTLFYAGAGEDFAPILLGSPGHIHSAFKWRFSQDPKVEHPDQILNVLKDVRTFVLTDIEWDEKNEYSRYKSLDHFVKFIETYFYHLTMGIKKFSHDEVNKILTFGCHDNILVEYHYGVDIFEELPPMLLKRANEAEVVYVQGFVIENNKEQTIRFANLFPKIKTIIKHEPYIGCGCFLQEIRKPEFIICINCKPETYGSYGISKHSPVYCNKCAIELDVPCICKSDELWLKLVKEKFGEVTVLHKSFSIGPADLVFS